MTFDMPIDDEHSSCIMEITELRNTIYDLKQSIQSARLVLLEAESVLRGIGRIELADRILELESVISRYVE